MAKDSKIVWKSDRQVALSGTMDEFFNYKDFFDQLKTNPSGSIEVDVSAIERINSVGVREWVRHMLSVHNHLTLVKCPPAIVDQVCMIPQFLGPSCEIKSFYGTFECGECGEELDKLYVVGRDIIKGEESYAEPDQIECKNCGNSMNFAHNHHVYFAFLQNKKAS